MKKFCNKIGNKQWRVTVPNINISPSLFRKSPSTDDSEKNNEVKRTSGAYDLEEAEKQFEKSRSLPGSVYVCEYNSESENDHFEETLTITGASSDEDKGLYADVLVTNQDEVSGNINQVNGKYEYDVPKISFKFFDKQNDPGENYENAQEATYEPIEIRTSNKHKTEVTINLKTPEASQDRPIETNAPRGRSKSLSIEEKFISSTTINLRPASCQQLPLITYRRSGSDPNVTLRKDEDVDDGLYKVPRSLKRNHRLSQSLNEFDVEKCETITSNDTSIEHISCSQVLPLPSIELPPRIPPPNPFKLKKVLRKPKKAVETWHNFRTKFNNLMSEHAAHQRVGAFDDKEKVTINLEEVYKSSKTKCKNVLKNTGKIFHKRRRSSNCDKSDVSSGKSDTKSGLKASDIEYRLNINNDASRTEIESDEEKVEPLKVVGTPTKLDDFDFASIKTAFKRSKGASEGQNGFDDLRRYVKQGSDFCKELSTILQERAEAETTYAKNLSKLSSKLARACREGVGGLNEGWKAVAVELEARAEGHRLMGASLLEEAVKPLRNLNENQQRSRKHVENQVDKASKSLSDWRTGEAKGKKHSHACARENEKLQDAAVLDTSKYGKLTLSRSTSLIQIAHMQKTADKENSKLEGKKRKAEDAVKKADIEYYTLCVRAERARLEWESAVLRGVNTFQLLEEERLKSLKNVLSSYLQHSNELGPRLIEATERLKQPVEQSEPTKDLSTFINLRQSSQQVSEQLLPDFYCEHITLAMNRERRKQALVKLLHLIQQDVERERKSKNGLENLSKAIKQTPNFGAEDSQQSVAEKLYHMKSMLTYLEGARYKVQNALAELDSKPRAGHPLAPHITITRDKSGLQQSILKVPQWVKEDWLEGDKSPLSEKSMKSDKSDLHVNDIDDPDTDWSDRGAADGNSNQPDSDFDEFSSQCSSSGAEKVNNAEENPVQPIAQCKALYPYTPNLNDELALRPGDVLAVYRQQDDGWWLGECNGNVGIFPATYVEILST